MKRKKISKSKFEIYTELNVYQNAPEKPGVFLLWAKPFRGNWECFHIGKSDNLKFDLLQFLSPDDSENPIKEKVRKFICGYEWTDIALD
ncbi:MAG: hypothetical protein PHV20_06890 [Bacteroidales bacterium]|nr:hypothetical protein [Bacteroidales bacterium]